MLKRSIPVIACLLLVWTTACSRPDTDQSPTSVTRDTTTAQSVEPAISSTIDTSPTPTDRGQIDAPATASSTPAPAKPTPTLKPTATPRPTRTPRPTPTPDPPPFAYANVEQGILLAFEELGYYADPEVPAVRRFLDQASFIRGIFHLTTADIGSINMSTDSYLEWLVAYVDSGIGAVDGKYWEYGRIVRQQAYIALTEPDSDIARTIQEAERILEASEMGASTQLYWEMLIGPSTPFGSTNAGLGMTNIFNRLASQYIRRHLSDPSNEPDFAAFLRENDFDSFFAPSTDGVPMTTPTPTPSRPSSDDQTPQRGDIVYQSPLSDWPDADYDTGWTRASSTSLHIGVYGDGSEHIVEEWTSRADFADISASVELREVSSRANAAGCISIRHDVAAGDYSFCIMGDGRSWAAHHYIDASGNWQVETLLWPEVRFDAKSTYNWNTIEIVAKGNQLWFVANSTVLGSVTHNERSVGAVAVSVTNWDAEQDAEFEFRDLVVRELK